MKRKVLEQKRCYLQSFLLRTTNFLYYWSKLYTSQMQEGMPYRSLRKTITDFPNWKTHYGAIAPPFRGGEVGCGVSLKP
ncbi:hypothetical protein BAU23_26825 [Bacillus nitratireducens]|nr:hypothetical protein BAU23_26825 [Bacillus nitratireducens]